MGELNPGENEFLKLEMERKRKAAGLKPGESPTTVPLAPPLSSVTTENIPTSPEGSNTSEQLLAILAAGPKKISLGSGSTVTTVTPGLANAKELADTYLKAKQEKEKQLGTEPSEQLKYEFRPNPATGDIMAWRPSEMNVEASLTSFDRDRIANIRQQAAIEKDVAQNALISRFKEIPEKDAADQALLAKRHSEIDAKAQADEDAIKSETRQRLVSTEKETVPGTGKLGQLSEAMAGLRQRGEALKSEQELNSFEQQQRSQKLQLAEYNVLEAEKQIAAAQIDPQRFYQGPVGALRAVLGAVAVAFGAYAQGLSGGKIPNTAVQIIEKAIDRDIDAQKINLQKIMLQRGYAKDQRDFVMERFNQTIGEKKALQLRETELFVAKHALSAEKESVREKFYDTINDLERKALTALELGKTKVDIKKTSGGHQVLDPTYGMVAKALLAKPPSTEAPGGGTKLPPNKISELSQSATMISQVKKLADELKGISMTPVTEWSPVAWFGTDAGQIEPKVNAIARVIGRMQGVEKGTFAQSDAKAMVDAIKGKRWDKAQDASKNLTQKWNEMIQTYTGSLKAYRAQGYSISGLRQFGTPVVVPEPTLGKGIRSAD